MKIGAPSTVSSARVGPSPAVANSPVGDRVTLSAGWTQEARQTWQAEDGRTQAAWLAAQSTARFGLAPRDLLRGPQGMERFSALAAEWRDANPQPF